ncbi:hypothetical protein GLA29479_511 [Lysobacter antibioticus]|nr:hypothetical protein GLA29479_511 [Lysobacter antibioticus]
MRRAAPSRLCVNGIGFSYPPARLRYDPAIRPRSSSRAGASS